MNSWTAGTRQQYDGHWRHFALWCQQRGITPLSATLLQLCDYLQTRLDEGLKPSTVRSYGNAIVTIRRHCNKPLEDNNGHLQRFLEGASRKAPAAARQTEALDIAPLLQYLRAMEPGDRREAARKKALVLVKIVTLARSADMANWLASSVKFNADGSLSVAAQRTKSSQARQVAYTIKPLPADPRLCPVTAFRAYWSLLQPLSQDQRVWRAIVAPFGGITADRIASEVRAVMREAGMQDSVHALRGAAATRAVAAGIGEEAVQQAGGWRSTEVFHDFYLRYKVNLSAALLGGLVD